MDSQQCGIQKDATCRVDSICCFNISDEGNDDDTANTVSIVVSTSIILRQKVLALLVAL